MPPAFEEENGQRWGACCPSSRAREASRCEFGPEFGSRDMFQDARAEQSGNEAREGAAAGRKGKRRSRELIASSVLSSSSIPFLIDPASLHPPASAVRCSPRTFWPPRKRRTSRASQLRKHGALEQSARGGSSREKPRKEGEKEGKKSEVKLLVLAAKAPAEVSTFPLFFFSGRFFSPFSLGGRDGVGRGVRETASEG